MKSLLGFRDVVTVDCGIAVTWYRSTARATRCITVASESKLTRRLR